MKTPGWIAVDLDGTLAHYDGWKGIEHIGEPIPAMLARVKQWIADGKTVKIFTARADPKQSNYHAAIAFVKVWCITHLGVALEITNAKDLAMIELFDDRCVQIVPNTGLRVDGKPLEEARQPMIAPILCKVCGGVRVGCVTGAEPICNGDCVEETI